MKDLIWFEKYRPTRLSQMALNPEYKNTFQGFIDRKEIPHILLYGPAGSGKTTISQILVDYLGAKCLKLNASSSDRGIGVIKTTVKQFAMSKSKQPNIVFFDEADGLTPDAQNALRNTMETYHQNCRFIFTCNNIDRIIEPLQSRCQLYQFESIPIVEVKRICQKILRREDVKFRRNTLADLVERYYPDVRSVINNLQSGSSSGTLRLDVLDRFDPSKFISFLDKGKIFALRNLWSNTVDFTRLYGVLFNQYCSRVRDNDTRADLMIMIAEYLYKDRTVSDREINFTACVLEIMVILEKRIDFKEAK